MMAADSSKPSSTESACSDDARDLLLSTGAAYAPDVSWSARTRGIKCRGQEALLQLLSGEATAMQEADVTLLRRSSNEHQSIEEFSVRFVYAGSGIEAAPIAAGDLVELKRVRIRERNDGMIVTEICIENWTVLQPADLRLSPNS